MPTFQAPRGTRDILPENQVVWRHITTVANQVAEQMGFQRITTPIYEDLALFERSIGEGTDVMDKELFLVRGKHAEGEAYALRPEGTAGIVRAYVEHGMHTWSQPVKLYSLLNCFRYERPQKGRYREHWQFDIEMFGERGAFADAWVIYATWLFLQRLGLMGISLKLNSLGTLSERQAYLSALQTYLAPLQDQLSEDSKRRLSSNPLRILDSKDEGDKRLLEHAPLLADFFSTETSSRFEEVKSYLESWHIPYFLDGSLVRGLDYYSHTTFEWVCTAAEGTQNALGGGGRYDGLLSQLGGPDTGAIGAGIGLDRIAEELAAQNLTEALTLHIPRVYVAAADEAGKSYARSLIAILAEEGIAIDANLEKDSLGSQIKSAGKTGARWVAIVGKNEADSSTVQLKDLETSTQVQVTVEEMLAILND
jgi:histidyl-tRNA synthetase